jgi:hypothetical protein
VRITSSGFRNEVTTLQTNASSTQDPFLILVTPVTRALQPLLRVLKKMWTVFRTLVLRY